MTPTGAETATTADGVPLADILREGTRLLAEAGVASARVDAELLAAHALDPAGVLRRGEVQAMALRGARLPADRVAVLTDLLRRRALRVPLQHLTGSASFRGLVLAVGPGVFVPRPETEVLAGLAVEEAAAIGPGTAGRPDGGPVVVDLCTGSGAVALAVAVEVPAARVVAVELEADALAWARRNVDELTRSHRPSAHALVDLRAGDAAGADTGVLADLAGSVDVVVGNPPYIPAGARPVDPEVAEHDPPAALYGGGDDGLDVPRAVVRSAAGLLRPGGLLLVEHADVQGAAMRALVGGDGWDGVRTERDLTGRDRVLVARRRACG